MPTIGEIRQNTPAWADKSDAEIAARAKEKGIPIDPEPAAPIGNGGGIPPNVAAGTQVLMERNAKPHVWEKFAQDHGLSLDDLVNYAQSVATGAAKAVIAAPGLPGDIKTGVDWAMNKILPMTPEQQAAYAQTNALTPPTSQPFIEAAQTAGVPFHEARSGTADPYFEAIGSFLSYSPAGKGAAARKLLSAVGGGVGSEAAGQLAQKYAPGLEGPARFLGGLGGGYAGGMSTRPAGARPQTPSTAELKSQATQKYVAAEQSGVVVPARDYDTIASQVNTTGLLSGADPDLTPKVTTAMKRVDAARGSDMSVHDMDMVRRKINLAAGSLDPNERRIASHMRDVFDDVYEQVAPPELAQARKLTRRYKGGEVLDEIQRQAPIKAAQYSQAGTENAYRERYRQLSMNQRKMRQFDPEARAAISKVATGTEPQNFLRGVGKYAPTGVIPFMGSVTAGGGAGYFLGDPAAGAAITTGLAGAGIAGKMANTALTKRNVRAAERAVRGDPQAMAAYQRALDQARREMLRQALLRAAATTPGLLQ